MSLLREIQKDAVDSNVKLATLLRKCKVLAARLGNLEFKQWVESELNGYNGNSSEELPNYRIIKVNSKGHFSGPFGSGLRNADMPLLCVPEEAREVLGHSYFRDPVAALEALVDQSDSGIAQEPWNPNLVQMFAQRFYENMFCLQAWKVISIAQIIGVLDTIRNKILSFALEIEGESPNAGEAPVNSNPVPQEKVHQIFNTYITGDVQNLATGSEDFQQTVNQADNSEVFSKLLGAVQSLSNPNLTSQLAPSIEKMRMTHGTRSFREHYLLFTSILADHMQILGPVVAPYLPVLAGFLR
jgi:hypothetical protein